TLSYCAIPLRAGTTRVGPKTTARVGSRRVGTRSRVRFEPASGRGLLPRPPFGSAERPRTPPRACFGIDTCRSATATAVNRRWQIVLILPSPIAIEVGGVYVVEGVQLAHGLASCFGHPR